MVSQKFFLVANLNVFAFRRAAQCYIPRRCVNMMMTPVPNGVRFAESFTLTRVVSYSKAEIEELVEKICFDYFHASAVINVFQLYV